MRTRCSAVILVCALMACDETSDPADAASETPRDAQAEDGGARDGSAGAAGAAADASNPGQLRAVAIRFAAKVGDEPFECGRVYDGVGTTGATITPRELRFYVQDLKLVTRSGIEVPVQLHERAPWQSETVALLDFATTDGGCARFATPETNDVITGRVPEGDYVGVAFTNGVPAAMNHADPSTLPAPLQVGGMHWTWLLGYRFVKLEVGAVAGAAPDAGGDDGADAGADGMAEAQPGFASLHVGEQACGGAPSTGFTCALANRNRVELDGFDPEENVIALDVGKVLRGVDVGRGSQCHGADSVCSAPYREIGIDYLTGAPLAAQNAYSVE